MVGRSQVVAEVDRPAGVFGKDLLFGEVHVVAAGDDEIDADAADAAAEAKFVVEGLVLTGEVAERVSGVRGHSIHGMS